MHDEKTKEALTQLRTSIKYDLPSYEGIRVSEALPTWMAAAVAEFGQQVYRIDQDLKLPFTEAYRGLPDPQPVG